MSSHRRKRKASKAPNASRARHPGTRRRKAVIAAAVVVAVGAVGATTVAQASGDGPGGWRDAASSWWGGQKSGPAPDPTPSSTPSKPERASVADAPAAATPSRTPSKRRSSPTPSASPSKKTSPPAKKRADTADKPARPPGTPNPAKAESTPTTAASNSDSGPTDRVLELVNAERAKAGCSPVTVDAKLTKAAQNHSQDMADHTNMSHTGSDGSSMTDRLARVGYAYRSAGENVAAGYGTAESVMDGWMNSPGHKANILNCGFKEIGIDLAGPGNYWTQNFGTPA